GSGRDARPPQPRDGAPDAPRARHHGHAVLRADVAVGDRAPPGHQPDARLPPAASGSRAAAQVRPTRNALEMALLESRAPADPLVLFKRWYRAAEHRGALQPNAIALATADANCTPSVRMVLYKGLIHLPAVRGGRPLLRPGGETRASQVGVDRFLFYTNYESRKGLDLAANSRAAIVFYWSMTR